MTTATTAIRATIHASTAEIPAPVWNAMSPGTGGRPDNPFLDHAFFLALEQSGSAVGRTGWQPQHITLEDDAGRTTALMPLFRKSHSQGEYVFDYGWADAFERAGGRYYPKLQSSVPFTPVPAPKLLVPSDEDRLKRALLDAAQQLAVRSDTSSVHATFVPEAEWDLAGERGWLRRTDTQYHWYNRGYRSFEDFLAALSSRKRKTIRRERRDALADGLTIRWITGSDLTEGHWDAFFAFYMDTGGRKWGRPYLNRAFFSLLSEAMADRVLLILAYDGDQPIAGALNLIGRDRIYGRNWGALREVPFLHFEVCYYQAIEFAIAHGLAVVEAGAQGEHKLARGYEPTPMHSIHWIAHEGLRHAVANFLDQERAAVLREQALMEQAMPFRRDDHGSDE